MKNAVITALLISASISLATAAEDPFTGKWKLNQSKSRFTGATDSVAAAGPNTYKFTYGAFSWTVKADGSDQPTPFNTTVALTIEGPGTWKLVNKINGKITSTETWTLAADGNTITRVSSGTRPNGDHFEDTTVVKRVGAGKGFEGKWQSTKVNQSSPVEVDVEPAANGGIIINVPSESLKYTVKFDGSDCPVSGPTVPPGATISGKRPNPREAQMTSKLNGKVIGTEEWRVSSDGKTFTLTEHDPGVPTPIIAVYDRM